MRIGVAERPYLNKMCIRDRADMMVDKLFGEKAEKVVMGLTVAFSIVMAVAIFMVLPYFAAALLRKVIVSDTILALIELSLIHI